jgi:hypothetical protein
MIRKIKSEEIPICVEVIKKSFLTVADGYGPLEGMILPPVVNLTFVSFCILRVMYNYLTRISLINFIFLIIITPHKF